MIADPFISPEIRHLIEQQYYARVNHQARLEQLITNPHFMASFNDHVGLFSDHGVIHARDVTRQILHVLDQIHGVLIPPRSSIRLSRMKGYGALVAYFHDIGMHDFSEFGRAMHPEFAAHALFNPELADVFNAIWQENSGNLAWHLTNLAAQNVLDQPPELILREMLALSICHSKSKVPIEVLNNLENLRSVMLHSLQFDLQELYLIQQQEKLRRKLEASASGAIPAADLQGLQQRKARIDQDLKSHPRISNPDLAYHYQDFNHQAYQWLLSPHPAVQELVQDVIDTLRALRCADALRQRGTLLTTSGEYEIYVDQRSANAVFGLRLGDEKLYLLEIHDPISGGEANIASSELDPACDLRISFHRGAFTAQGATEYAVYSAALVVQDIQKDVICSFVRPDDELPEAGIKTASGMQILLEETDDNLGFVEMVCDQLRVLEPAIRARLRIVPSLKQASDRERALYLDAPPLDWDLAARRALLDRVAASGHVVDNIDLQLAFDEVKLITLNPGQVLLEAGAPAAFVYIPLESGLKVIPKSGHAPFLVQPWMPLGVTGVIRGAARNATVQAELVVRLLMIPKTTYLKHWHSTHSVASFKEAVAHLP